MKLFGTEKDCTGRRTYFFGLKVYEEVKKWNTRKIYFLGIKIRKKKISSNLTLQKLYDFTRVSAAEQKILTLAVLYKDLALEKKHFLLFDHLADPYAEAIDAWTLFQYLKENNVPSKYVLLKNNKLYNKLLNENNMDDIIPVQSELDFLEHHAEEIVFSHTILSSFGFFTGKNVFKLLPQSKYVFIEHGVILLNKWAAQFYSDKGHLAADKILVPTRKTKELYDSLGIWKDKMYCCGLPRWDKLPSKRNDLKQRNIYIFFTMRETFRTEKKLRSIYLKRIQDFINAVKGLIANNTDIKIYITPHHTLMQQEKSCDFSFLHNAIIVPPEDMSTMIKKTDLFITDYSSACFDSIYRNIPVIFYCFDADLEYKNERDKNPKKAAAVAEELLYNSCYNLQSALSRIQHYVNNGFELEKEYAIKNDALFWDRSNNCKRLLSLLSEDNNI